MEPKRLAEADVMGPEFFVVTTAPARDGKRPVAPCPSIGQPPSHAQLRHPATLVQGQRPDGVLMPSVAVQVPQEVAQRAQQGAADAAAGEQADGDSGPDREAYLVPACAAWFRWDGIADVEEAHFKDFLAADAEANPERYREYRNAIINKYRHGAGAWGLGRAVVCTVQAGRGWAWH